MSLAESVTHFGNPLWIGFVREDETRSSERRNCIRDSRNAQACTPQAATQTEVPASNRMNLNPAKLPDVLGVSLQALYDVPERFGAAPGGDFPIDRH